MVARLHQLQMRKRSRLCTAGSTMEQVWNNLRKEFLWIPPTDCQCPAEQLHLVHLWHNPPPASLLSPGPWLNYMMRWLSWTKYSWSVYNQFICFLLQHRYMLTEKLIHCWSIVTGRSPCGMLSLLIVVFYKKYILDIQQCIYTLQDVKHLPSGDTNLLKLELFRAWIVPVFSFTCLL